MASSSTTAISSDVGLLGKLKALYRRRETVQFLVVSNLKAGHRDKLLGHLWSLLDPLLFAGVYFVVFGFIFRMTSRGRGADFMIYLVVGVFAWKFMEGAVMQATTCIRGRRGLLHEINFPKGVLPVSICLSRLYDFLWGQVAAIAIILILGKSISLQIAWLPLIIFLQLLFTLGLAFMVSYLGAFFADTENIVNVGMRLWFFMSPLFYYVDDVVKDGEVIAKAHIPEAYRAIFMLNPMAGFLGAYRDSLLYHTAPDQMELLNLVTVSIVFFVVGFAMFVRGEGSFAKYV